VKDTDDLWATLAKIGGLGAIATAGSVKLLQYFRRTKREAIDEHESFRAMLIARITKLEADLDELRENYEKRLDALRKELEVCRDECRKLSIDARNFERLRFMPPVNPE